MQRVPGIVFADTPVGTRVARIAGTGLEVFEVVSQFRLMDEDWNRFRRAFHWLNDDQLRAAVSYAETFPGDIDPLIDELRNFDLEEVWRKYPFMKPAR
jgi:hypothetical protein